VEEHVVAIGNGKPVLVVESFRGPFDQGEKSLASGPLSRRTKQIIPRELARVASNLDESEDFEKARISIDWMNTCLKNFTKDYKLGFCSRNRSYFCAIDPQSDGCLQSQ
jgi:hypothetical protein